MKCPHCGEHFTASLREYSIPETEGAGETGKGFRIIWTKCDNFGCQRLIIKFHQGQAIRLSQGHISWEKEKDIKIKMIHPPTAMRSLPLEIRDKYGEDFNEACLILADSPKASAALSRRCLQNFLREELKVKKSDLSSEIQEILDKKILPSHLADSIDAIRNIGNFGAHPIKSKSTGEIVAVEPGEAEWDLDVLEMLFDFIIIQPLMAEKRRAALDAKLKDAGKPPMKKRPDESE